MNEFNILRRLPFPIAFVESPVEPGFPDHTSGDADYKGLVLRFCESPGFADISVYPVLSLLSYRAGIEEEYVGLAAFQNFPEPSLEEDHIDFLGIGIVHLAAEGFEEVIHFIREKIC